MKLSFAKHRGFFFNCIIKWFIIWSFSTCGTQFVVIKGGKRCLCVPGVPAMFGPFHIINQVLRKPYKVIKKNIYCIRYASVSLFILWPRGKENLKRDLQNVSFISPRQLWDPYDTKLRQRFISPVSQAFLWSNKMH